MYNQLKIQLNQFSCKSIFSFLFSKEKKKIISYQIILTLILIKKLGTQEAS